MIRYRVCTVLAGKPAPLVGLPAYLDVAEAFAAMRARAGGQNTPPGWFVMVENSDNGAPTACPCKEVHTCPRK